MKMTSEEIRIFNLVSGYVKKYLGQLQDCELDARAGVCRLTFKSDKGQIRSVTFFKDQFDHAVVKNELGEAIIKNIDEALQ